MKKPLLALVAAAALTAGCAGFPGFTNTQQGGATGAAIGSIAGDTGWGAAPGGYVHDKSKKAQQ